MHFVEITFTERIFIRGVIFVIRLVIARYIRILNIVFRVFVHFLVGHALCYRFEKS